MEMHIKCHETNSFKYRIIVIIIPVIAVRVFL